MQTGGLADGHKYVFKQKFKLKEYGTLDLS